jgi:hypothetical protein
MEVGAARRVLARESDRRLCSCIASIGNKSLVFEHEFLTSGHSLSDAVAQFCSSHVPTVPFSQCSEEVMQCCRSEFRSRYGSNEWSVLRSALVGDQEELRVELYLVPERAAYEILVPSRAQTRAVARSFAEWRGLGGGDRDQLARQEAELHATLRKQWPCQGHDAVPRAMAPLPPPTAGDGADVGRLPKIIWFYWDPAPGGPSSISIAAAVRSFTRQRGWRVQGVNASTLSAYLSPEELPAHFAELDSVQRMTDAVRLALLFKYGGVWCDASIWLAAPLEQWLEPVVQGGAQFVAFTSFNRFVENWFLAATRRNAVIGRWRDTFFAELDAAVLRTKRHHSLLATELRASALWHATDTTGIDIDMAYLFISLSLMHLRQHDSDVAAAFAGPTVVLFNAHDDALWMPTERTQISQGATYESVVHSRSITRTVGELLEYEQLLAREGRVYKLTKLTSTVRKQVDDDVHSFARLQPRRALLELLERALGEELLLDSTD